MKETVKSCSNCRYSYDLPSNRGPMAKKQYCRNKNYNSVNYTTKMLLEDWDQGHCRFWASIPEEGNDNEK